MQSLQALAARFEVLNQRLARLAGWLTLGIALLLATSLLRHFLFGAEQMLEFRLAGGLNLALCLFGLGLTGMATSLHLPEGERLSTGQRYGMVLLFGPLCVGLFAVAVQSLRRGGAEGWMLAGNLALMLCAVWMALSALAVWRRPEPVVPVESEEE